MQRKQKHRLKTLSKTEAQKSILIFCKLVHTLSELKFRSNKHHNDFQRTSIFVLNNNKISTPKIYDHKQNIAGNQMQILLLIVYSHSRATTRLATTGRTTQGEIITWSRDQLWVGVLKDSSGFLVHPDEALTGAGVWITWQIMGQKFLDSTQDFRDIIRIMWSRVENSLTSTNARVHGIFWPRTQACV